jgi:adsorption protein B
LNLFALVVRLVVRLAACGQVYGKLDFLGVIERWPVAAIVNFVAVFRAWKTYLTESEFATKPIVWSKTAHEVPDDFTTSNR